MWEFKRFATGAWFVEVFYFCVGKIKITLRSPLSSGCNLIPGKYGTSLLCFCDVNLSAFLFMSATKGRLTFCLSISAHKLPLMFTTWLSTRMKMRLPRWSGPCRKIIMVILVLALVFIHVCRRVQVHLYICRSNG